MGYMLVMDEQRDTVVIGVGKEGCDPKQFKVLKADDGKEGCLWAAQAPARWAMALANLPQLIQEAEGAWAINPLNPAATKAAKAAPAKAAPAEPPAAAATVTEAPTPTEELPLLEQSEEERTMETTPPVDDPGLEAPVGPEDAQEPQEAPVGPEETPEAPVAQEAVGGELGPPTMTGGYEAQPGDPPATEAEAAPAPAAPAGGNGGSWRYYVKDGHAEAGFDTVHGALLALGVTQEEIDAHKYWHRYDRLPKVHADAIRRERVGSG